MRTTTALLSATASLLLLAGCSNGSSHTASTQQVTSTSTTPASSTSASVSPSTTHAANSPSASTPLTRTATPSTTRAAVPTSSAPHAVTPATSPAAIKTKTASTGCVTPDGKQLRLTGVSCGFGINMYEACQHEEPNIGENYTAYSPTTKQEYNFECQQDPDGTAGAGGGNIANNGSIRWAM